MSQALRERHPRAPIRVVALTMLVAFVLAQSWVVCAPLCLLHRHATTLTAEPQTHGMRCHTDDVLSSRLPLAESLSIMLPSRVAATLPLLPLERFAFAQSAQFQLQQLPPADPPPPRLV